MWLRLQYCVLISSQVEKAGLITVLLKWPTVAQQVSRGAGQLACSRTRVLPHKSVPELPARTMPAVDSARIWATLLISRPPEFRVPFPLAHLLQQGPLDGYTCFYIDSLTSLPPPTLLLDPVFPSGKHTMSETSHPSLWRGFFVVSRYFTTLRGGMCNLSTRI